MAYSSGMLRSTIDVLGKRIVEDNEFGRVGGDYVPIAKLHANVTWTKGVKALREGSIDAYNTIMVRTRYTETLKRECRLLIDGTTYQITDMKADKHANTMQMLCQELKTK